MSVVALGTILLAVLLTSLLSGVLGMAGGLILVAILVLLLPVPAAMILHGVVQSVANGSRAWFLRHEIVWSILPPYLLGLVITTGVFIFGSFVADRAIVMVIVGSFPWIGLLLPQRFALDITQSGTAVLCGIVVTGTQLLAGASGPTLDVFYQRTNLNRFQIVATKAFTQVCGHIVKVGYFVLLSATSVTYSLTDLPPWLVGLATVFAIAGTWFGTRLLERFDEERFRTITNVCILSIGAVIATTGVVDYVNR